MENKINIAELLKNCPKGMELYSPLCGRCTFDRLNMGTIICKKQNTQEIAFTSEGYYMIPVFNDCECMLFPSKNQRDWSKFQIPFKDGDIVAMGTGTLTQVFIFKEYANREMNYVHCYMALSTNGIISLNDGYYYVSRFATGEEKKKLFDAIKASGHRWNPETKTLEELVELQFKVGDRIKHKYNIWPTHTVTEIKDTHYILDGELVFPFIFQDEYEIVSDKFNINTLKPFDKVLARDTYKQVWTADIFSHKVEKVYVFACIGHFWNQCIPYEGNEHLLGTSNDCDKFYKTWE